MLRFDFRPLLVVSVLASTACSGAIEEPLSLAAPDAGAGTPAAEPASAEPDEASVLDEALAEDLSALTEEEHADAARDWPVLDEAPNGEDTYQAEAVQKVYVVPGAPTMPVRVSTGWQSAPADLQARAISEIRTTCTFRGYGQPYNCVSHGRTPGRPNADGVIVDSTFHPGRSNRQRPLRELFPRFEARRSAYFDEVNTNPFSQPMVVTRIHQVGMDRIRRRMPRVNVETRGISGGDGVCALGTSGDYLQGCLGSLASAVTCSVGSPAAGIACGLIAEVAQSLVGNPTCIGGIMNAFIERNDCRPGYWDVEGVCRANRQPLRASVESIRRYRLEDGFVVVGTYNALPANLGGISVFSYSGPLTIQYEAGRPTTTTFPWWNCRQTCGLNTEDCAANGIRTSFDISRITRRAPGAPAIRQQVQF
jgi:hypothetical protein